MCPTSASSSVETAQSSDTSCPPSDREYSSRSRVPKPVPILSTTSKQKVSARTGVSVNRLQGLTNNRQGAQLSDNRDEVSHLEDSASTAILWDTDSMMSQPCLNMVTQPSITTSHLNLASASAGHRSGTPDRHTPTTNRSAKSTSASSITKTARSMASTTSRGPRVSRDTPNHSRPISTACSPYSTDRASMSPYRSPGAAPTHVYPNQEVRGQPLGSISQAPLLSSLPGRSSEHPTALKISDNEAIGRGIGQALTGDNSGSSTRRTRLATKKAHLSKEVSISEPRSQTSQALDSTSTYANTNDNELAASAASTTGVVATTFLDPGKRREHYKQCRECGKSQTAASAQKKPVPAENLFVQVFQTNDGLQFRVKMRLDARGLSKTGDSASTARCGATTSACLPAGVESGKAMINGKNVCQPQPPSHQ